MQKTLFIVGILGLFSTGIAHSKTLGEQMKEGFRAACIAEAGQVVNRSAEETVCTKGGDAAHIIAEADRGAIWWDSQSVASAVFVSFPKHCKVMGGELKELEDRYVCSTADAWVAMSSRGIEFQAK